ncbi:MAG: hypothetical protein HY852_20995 [Bradyrhizobium sp.]|uniref:hypothetical protein n=1 Tax=Bradyrhizobium sp. TaxID=376 RepID=UPI0025C72EA2|nr:hypothetical protein [Bradyrhizobium sp.]MBI5264288.1 hypothetical protein [Bradyrhizobium sp.]
MLDVICPTVKASYFERQDWTGQISLKSLTKWQFGRSRFSSLSSVRGASIELNCRAGQIGPTKSAVIVNVEPGIHFTTDLCGSMDSGPACFARIPE